MAFSDVVNAFIRMEGSDLPNSVNQTMVRTYGKWNVGHLIWAGQYGAVPVMINGRQWAGWPSREEAVAGLERDLKAKAARGDTLAAAITAYAPPSENNTAAYIANVSQWSGYPPDTPLASIVADGGAGNPTTPPPSQPHPEPQPGTATQTPEMVEALAAAEQICSGAKRLAALVGTLINRRPS